MAQVSVSINDKLYPLACADGEEERLKKLAAYVDSKTRDIAGKLGHVNEARLILMAALIIADELHDTVEGKENHNFLGSISENDLAAILNEVASEVEGIAEKLSTS